MNRFQKRHYRQQSRLAAGTYIAAAECVGKEFVFGSCAYRVIEHHPERWTFTLEIINAFNQRIEKDETFVRHHCTPVQAPTPRATEVRPGQPRYSLFPAITINDKTEVGDTMKATELTTIQLNTTLEVEPCVDTPANVDPAYYLDQKFVWTTEDGTTFNCTVQAWNEDRQQFRLYEPRGGCWYREPEFVYAHCQPAAAPVVREPLPQIEFDPRRYWNLVSLSDKRKYIADDVQATGVPQPDPLLQCECCQQHVTIIGKQVFPAKYKLKDLIMVECQNEDCIAHRRTASTESHHQICDDARCEAAGKERAS